MDDHIQLPRVLVDDAENWEAREFDLVTQWVELCRYFDGWTARDTAIAARLRHRIFFKHRITAIEVVVFEYEDIDESDGCECR